MSLIAHYPLNGDTLDYSGNNNNMTNSGATIDTSGKIGRCYNFDGANRFMASNNQVKPYNLTLAVWVYPTIFEGLEGIITLHDYNGDVNPSGIGLNLVNGKVSSSAGYINNSRDYNSRLSVNTLPLNIWSHILLTFDYNTRKMVYYINGVFDSEFILSEVRITSMNINLSTWSVNYHADYDFIGKLNDVRVYDHVLSVKEIKEISKAKVLHYSFNDYQEPTTNVLPNDKALLISYIDHGGTHATDTNFKLFGNNTLKNTSNPAQDWNGVYITGMSSLLTVGETYTYSFYIYFLEANTTITYFGYGAPYFTGVQGQWNRVTTTFVATSQDHFYVCLQSSLNLPVTTYYLANIQIEKKSYATPFTLGSRSSIVTDISSYGNNATLIETTTPKFVVDNGKLGSGGYYFKGVNECIKVNTLGITTPLTGFTKCTISFWRKNDSTITSWLPFTGLDQNGGVYLMACDSGTGNFYHNSSGVNLIIYKDGVNSGTNVSPFTDQLWHHYVIKDVDLSLWTMFKISGYSGVWNCEGTFDDIRIYNTSFSDADVLELYQTRAQLDNSGNLFINEVSTNGFKPSLIDYSQWVIDSYNSQGSSVVGGNFYSNGVAGENKIIVKANPIGENDVVWATLGNDTESNADGGWDGDHVPIDKNRRYRLSVWVRRENVGNGNIYFGTQNVCDLGSTTINGNPYFLAFGSGFGEVINGWVLMVGYIHPLSYSGGSDSTNGIYSVNGTRITGATDYRWGSTSTTSNLRTYLYYSTATTERQYWYRPRFDLVDGNEPSISQLLSCLEHRPLINSSNVYDFNKYQITGGGVAKYNNISELGITDALVGFWKLNGDAKDYSGNGNNGVVNGTTITNGSKKLAYNFNGTSDFIKINTTYFYKNLYDEITVSCWINPSRLGGQYQSIIVNRDNTKYNWMLFQHTTDGSIQFHGVNQNKSTYIPTVGTWTHIVATVTSSQVYTLYANGVVVQTVTGYDYERSTGIPTAVFIGNFGDVYEFYQGKISDARIYNRALSEKEAIIQYKYGLPTTGMQLSSDGTLFLNNEINENI